MGLLRALALDVRSWKAALGWWTDEIIRDLPGDFGITLRRLLTGRRFGAVGQGLVLEPGVRFIGMHNLSVGRNCRLGRDNILQASGGIEIGDDVVLDAGVKIWSVNHVFARTDVPIYEQGYEHKPVVIGNGVWIGGNSFVMPGARIGDYAVISPGSVVSGKDIEPYSILAGNPARKVGTRAAFAAPGPPPGLGSPPAAAALGAPAGQSSER